MSSRTYVVGVPLVITVSDTGVVTYEVDASEISSEMSERFGEDEDFDGTENEMLLDGAIVDAHLGAGNFPQTELMGDLGPVECPVRHGCKFQTRDLGEMAQHIDDFDHSDADKF